MKVMVIVKATSDSEAGELPSTELLAAMGQYNEELARAGIMLAGEGLHPSSRGARVHFSGKNRTVIDGPFAETKELIAGFWLWRVGSIQEAIDWVKKCPNPMNVDSDIEIRQVFEADDFGENFTPELRRDESRVLARTLGLEPPTFSAGREMRIAGLKRRYTQDAVAGIPRQWEEFAKEISRISHRVGSDSYGVAWNFSPTCDFDYLCGVEVSDADRLPDELTSICLESRPYAVFAHSGHVSALSKTIDTIWSKWAPDCGLKIAHNAPCVERYTSEFNASSGLGGMELLVPLETDD